MSDAELYKRQGMGNRIGFGKKAALVLVDFTVGFNDPNAFGGGNVNDAVQNTVALLAAARRNKVPIAYTRVMYAKDGSNVGVFATKNKKLAELTMDNPLSHIVPELPAQPGDYIIDKTEASAFLGTGFASYHDALQARVGAQLSQIDATRQPHAREMLQLALSQFAAAQGLRAEQANLVYLRDKVALKTHERVAK